MPQRGTIYRVLVASPSDCVAERRLIPDVLYSWNAAHSRTTAAILEPVRWETHARPEVGDRPQALLNKQLVEDCDILIGTFWTRLGTATGEAVSGTAEEIEQFRGKGKPVLLYFSSAPVVPESLEPEQFKALSEYKRRLGGEGLYFGYDAVQSLRDLLTRHVANTMADLHHRDAPQKDEADTQMGELQQYREQFDAFVRRLDAEWASERDSGPMSIDEGKMILASAVTELVSLRSQIVDGLESVTLLLDEVAVSFRTLQRHSLRLDGGKSIRVFWEAGDDAIGRLKTVPQLLDASETSTGA